MTKGKIFKTFILVILFSAIAVGFYVLAFALCNLSFAGTTGIAYAGGRNILSALKAPLSQEYYLVKVIFGVTAIEGGYGAVYTKAFTDPLHNFGLFSMIIMIGIYLISVIVTIIQTFTYRKPSLLLNIIWSGILIVVVGYVISAGHLALYGNSALRQIGGSIKGNPAANEGSPLYSLIAGWDSKFPVGKYFKETIKPEFQAKAFFKTLAIIASAWAFIVFVLVVLISSITYLVKLSVYVAQHKYDYLTKRERKEKIKYYKGHGFENINKKDTKKKKGQIEDQPNPYVQQQQQAIGMAPQGGYPYPYFIQQPNPVIIPPSAGNTVQTGNNAPLIVQYINTSSNEDSAKLKNSKQGQSTDIYESRVQTPRLTKNDIKDTIVDVLKENNILVAKQEKVEPVAAPVEEKKEDEYDLLTLDDLVTIIKNTVGEAKPAEPVEKKEESKPVTIEDIHKIVEETLNEREDSYYDDCECDCCCCEGHEYKEEKEEKIIPPIVVAMPSKIQEAKAETEPVQEETVTEEPEERITEEDLRTLVREQLKDALKDIKVETKETIKEVPVYVSQPAPREVIKEVIKEVKVPAEPVVVPTPEPVKEVVVEKKPLIKQPDVRGKENIIKKEEAEKLNFDEKLLTAGSEIVLAYNSLKNLLISYGLKDRLSNSGDTFRLHKVTYCKIAMGGSHLKIYLALNPNDFKNSQIAVGNAGFKDAYKDIPLVFRVKSDASLKKARDLITKCMEEKEIKQVAEEGNVDYASLLKK